LKLILAGDIGATKTHLGIFRKHSLRMVKEARFFNKNYSAVEEILAEFLGMDVSPIGAACFGVAAPVEKNRAVLTNLGWVVDARAVARNIGIKKVSLINDIVATGWGLTLVEKKMLFVLKKGKRTSGNGALVAPGTGLGEAMLFWDGSGFVPSASEGGHADFAPRNAFEIGLLTHLMEKFGHVSYERVASGQGIKNIYDYIMRKRPVSPRLKKRFENEDPSAVISDEARRGNSACRIAMEVFASVLGAEAGNLALKTLSTGVYIGGGVVPKTLETFDKKAFIEGFCDKGRFRGFLSGIPVYVIMDERAALLGAAKCATMI
jgi:glucokinase